MKSKIKGDSVVWNVEKKNIVGEGLMKSMLKSKWLRQAEGC